MKATENFEKVDKVDEIGNNHDVHRPKTIYQRWITSEVVNESINFVKEESEKPIDSSNSTYQRLKEFCDQSALLGFLYIGDTSRPMSERIWWAIAMALSLFASLLLVQRVWDKWSTSPVIVSFSETPTPNWEIPFPAVTVCPQMKYTRSFLKKGESLFMNRTLINEYRRLFLDDVALLCRRYSGMWDSLTPDLYQRFTDEDIYDRLKFASGDMSEYPDLPKYLRCKYGYKTAFCEDNFQEVFTSDGWCQTFNLLPRGSVFTRITSARRQYELLNIPVVDWTLENGFMVAVEVDTKPYRITNSVYDRGLMLMMTSDIEDLDYSCQDVQGYKVAFTNPAEFPRTNDRFIYIPISGLTQMIIEPSLMETSEGLRSYNPNKRHCLFSSERQLAFFTTYTQSNCDLECLTNFTLKECECVEFFMPRQKGTSICGLGSSACVRKTELRLYEESMAEILQKVKSNHTCNCIPECTSIQYQAEVIHSEYKGGESRRNIKKYRKNYSFTRNIKRSRTNFSTSVQHRVVISFKTTEVLSRQRAPLYNYVDFIASCGGLLSLFFGFSIISFLEIVYFFTVRIGIKNNGENTK